MSIAMSDNDRTCQFYKWSTGIVLATILCAALGCGLYALCATLANIRDNERAIRDTVDQTSFKITDLSWKRLQEVQSAIQSSIYEAEQRLSQPLEPKVIPEHVIMQRAEESR